MIDLVKLNGELQQTGCSIVREENFFCLASITGSTCRFLCASSAALRGNAVWPSGFSFWLHEGQSLAFVGLWSGFLYLIPHADSITAVCKDLCFGRTRPETGPLTKLPHDVAEKYQMQQIDILVLADDDAEFLDDASEPGKPFPYSEREFIERIEREVDSVQKDSAGCVHLTMGNSHAFTKFLDAQNDQTRLCIAFHGGLRETDEQVRLLSLLASAFPLALFDGSWGNRIDPADPYYGSPRNESRPSEPMNFHD